MAITEKILFSFPNMRAQRFSAIPSPCLFSSCPSSASSCREEPTFADPLSSVSSSFPLVYCSKGCKGGKRGSLKQKALCNQTKRKHLSSCFQLCAYRSRAPNIDRGKEGKKRRWQNLLKKNKSLFFNGMAFQRLIIMSRAAPTKLGS